MITFVKSHPNLAALVVGTAIVFLAAVLRFNVTLDTLQKIFSLVGSFSLVVALSTYFYKKHQDRTIVAIDQISFYRKEIIIALHELTALIKKKYPAYEGSNIILEEPTIEFARQHYGKNFKAQTEIFFKNKEVDQEVLDAYVFFFNMLEEFSLKVFHFKTEQHPALVSVRAVFAQTIEQNAAALLFIRYVLMGNNAYSETLRLYSIWKNTMDREYPIVRLKKYGFIAP